MTDPYIGINGTKIEFSGNIDGWILSAGGIFALATRITVASGTALIYQKGDKLRWKQGVGYKYGTVREVVDTYLELIPNADFTVANAAITDMAYSHIENPLGFPTTFNFITTPTAEGSAYTNAPTINKAIFWIKGNIATVKIQWTFNATSGGTGSCLFTLPVTATYQYQTGYGSNISAVLSLAVRTGSSNTSVTVAKYDGTTPIVNSNMCEIAIVITI